MINQSIYHAYQPAAPHPAPVQDVDEAELSIEEAKERKIMKLLLKVKNGTPPQRKAALRQLTDKARDFGAGPLFNQILPLLVGGGGGGGGSVVVYWVCIAALLVQVVCMVFAQYACLFNADSRPYKVNRTSWPCMPNAALFTHTDT